MRGVIATSKRRERGLFFSVHYNQKGDTFFHQRSAVFNRFKFDFSLKEKSLVIFAQV